MDAKLTTKKFLNALTRDGRASTRRSFVLPALDGSPWFVAMRSGKRHDNAYVVYVGRSITVDDVLQELSLTCNDLDHARRLIYALFLELQQLKLGNVVAIYHSERDSVKLRLVSSRTKPDPGPKLPG